MEINKYKEVDCKIIKNVIVTMPGKHNVRNSLASIALALELGISDKIIKNTLKKF